jgi:hypothetical protein
MIRHYSGYVSVDWKFDGEDIEPLLYCLRFAISDAFPVDYFLRGILMGDESAPSGGDPGWVLYQDRVEAGRMIYHAWTNPDMSYLGPSEGDYDEDIVKLHVRRTLDNFAKAHPECRTEVDQIVAQYDL